MRVTILGACGGWPEAGQGCSGFLVEHRGFRLLVDAGYATMPRLLETVTAEAVDAVFISHGHPDHCADLNPLLRARVFAADPPPPLPVYALPGALDAVLALDQPGILDRGYTLHPVTAGSYLDIGPFDGRTRLLPHWLPNIGLRLEADGKALAYTGDTGPSPDIADLARGADILIADASYVDLVPPIHQRYQSSARDAGQHAAQAGANQLTLTHLMPGTDRRAARAAARTAYDGTIHIATAGLVLDLDDLPERPASPESQPSAE